MSRFFLVSFFLTLIYLLFPRPSYSANDFTLDANVEYKIQESGTTSVTNTIRLRNNSSLTYGKSFKLNLVGVNPKNLKAYEEGNQLTLFSEKEADFVSIRIEFATPLAGKGRQRTFVVTYEDESLATKTGEIWEISIPKLGKSETFREYSVLVSVPNTFGEEAYISPEPREIKKNEDRRFYAFKKDDLKNAGISAAFGKFQVFSFTIHYHLENSSNEESQSLIALPPDTSLQEVSFSEITPEPGNVSVDEDGNWLAAYKLLPRQKIDVKVSGAVSIFAKPRKLLSPTPASLLSNLKPTYYWQTDDPAIRELAGELKTPQKIFDYVSQTLTYNYDRVKPNTKRLGARAALLNPANAICMEFTDLFIALSRAAGIPAREINGYAYSENPRIQPLSLVADVLHAWPEYWDKDTSTWIAVDPTWSSTSGVDYFTKLDLRHFAFVIHGRNDSEPASPGSYKLGANPQKDVFVSLGLQAPKSQSDIDVVITYPKSFPLFKRTLDVQIVNRGANAVYDVTAQILFDQDSLSSSYYQVLPPKAHVDKQIEIPLGLLGSKAPENITVKAYRSEKTIASGKGEAIIYQILILSLILIGILGFASYKMAARGRLRAAGKKGNKKT